MNDFTATLPMLIWVILYIATAVPMSKKFTYPKKQVAQINKLKQEVADKVISDGRYVKYAKEINLQAFLTYSAIFILDIALIFFFFIPNFQIKAELFGETLFLQNFSLCESIMDTAKNDGDATFEIMLILLPVALMLSGAIRGATAEIKSFDGKKRAGIIFADIYVDLQNKRPAYLAVSINVILSFFMITVLYVLMIIQGKTAEAMPNAENLLQSCTGVSGFISFPVLFFAAGAGLIGCSLYLKCKLAAKIETELVSDMQGATAADASVIPAENIPARPKEFNPAPYGTPSLIPPSDGGGAEGDGDEKSAEENKISSEEKTGDAFYKPRR